MTSDDKLGSIDVKMGSNNFVGHIGHKITFHEPPPNPNTIWQNGQATGTIGGPATFHDGVYLFEKLFVEVGFDAAQEFELQGVRLCINGHDAETSTSIGGRPPLRTLWRVNCRKL